MLEVQKKTLKKGRRVDTKHVDTVIRNYKQERWVHNSERLGKEDSLSVWYSIDELQEFMEMSKEHGADGIKVYFGAYSEDYKENPLYAGRQTVVLVATKQKQTMHGETNKDLFVPSDNGSVILAYNMGGLCPPYCGTGTGTIGGGFGSSVGITIVDKGEGGLIVT